MLSRDHSIPPSHPPPPKLAALDHSPPGGKQGLPGEQELILPLFVHLKILLEGSGGCWKGCVW